VRRHFALAFPPLLIAIAFGCGGKREQVAPGESTEPAAPVSASSLEVAEAEAERSFGIEALARLARSGPLELRARAIAGLGRVGGERAVAIVLELLDDPSADIQIAALGALWTAGDSAAATRVASAYRDTDDPLVRAVAVETLGHIGTAAELPVLRDALAAKPGNVSAAGALALGLYGRRELPLWEDAAMALATALGAGAERDDVRYGVAYALARQHEPSASPVAERLLRQLAVDAFPQVRAVALTGLARRAVAAGDVFEVALADEHWRVRVQAVRALAGKASTAAMRAALARWLVGEWRAVRGDAARLVSGDVQPLLEALTLLRSHAREKSVGAALATLYTESKPLEGVAPTQQRTVDAVNCLAAAARGRFDDVLSCGAEDATGWPAHLRRALAAEIADGNQLVALLSDADARVRGAALARALSLDDVPMPALEAVGAAIASKHAAEVGSVVAALAERAQARGDASFAVFLDGRARRELAANSVEAELLIGIFDTLAAMGVEKWAKTCRKALAHPNRTVRDKARACVAQLTGRDVRAVEPAAAPPKPPVDPSTVLGKRVVWRLTTPKGLITMELEPDAAPWHVAALVSLARAGFYDGLLWHRVVADFVVQGGDPTGSGWGGSGYLIPGEPTAPTGWFERGAVGIADSGLDTGGCQIFIMHSRAPHLEGSSSRSRRADCRATRRPARRSARRHRRGRRGRRRRARRSRLRPVR